MMKFTTYKIFNEKLTFSEKLILEAFNEKINTLVNFLEQDEYGEDQENYEILNELAIDYKRFELDNITDLLEKFENSLVVTGKAVKFTSEGQFKEDAENSIFGKELSEFVKNL